VAEPGSGFPPGEPGPEKGHRLRSTGERRKGGAMDLEGKTVVVTGAAGGIGMASGVEVARGGASVVLVDLDGEALEQSARTVAEAGAEVRTVVADVSRSEDVQAFVEATLSAFGRMDALFNNAGIEGAFMPTADYPEEVFERVIAVNLRGVFLGLKHAIPMMVEQGGGSIINTSSIAGERGLPGSAAYVASKHGVIGLTKTAAAEYAARGVRVNAICPGMIDTRMLRSVAGSAVPDDPEGAVANFAAAAPIVRAGRPSEIGAVVRFLASDASSFVTGVAWPVDGGALASLAGDWR
jgi:NAD(P)-dependent dehydrogenase (short-subunit alcohol dehydrogenase family)